VSDLIVALPSKGTLQSPTLSLLRRCFLDVSSDGSDRSYIAELNGMPGASVLFARADEIPRLVQAARAHVGITGLDLFREAQEAETDRRARLVIDDLGFGTARLVVGLPSSWLDVADIADLIEVAHDIRQRRGRPLLVATKFPSLTRKHLTHNGLRDFRIVQSLGATEAAPQTGSADVIVDLVSTGRTFANNGLKTISGGLVLSSQACLIASGNAGLWGEESQQQFRHFGELVSAGLQAQSMRSVRATFPDALSEVPRPLARLLHDARLFAPLSGSVEVHGAVNTAAIHELLAETRRAGARNVEVSQSEIILEHESTKIEIFLSDVLKKSESGSRRRV
jgi:ATP phosphoribosyltransferase